MSEPNFHYVSIIRTTPQKLWEALVTTEFIRHYWIGRSNTSTWEKGAALESRSPEGKLEWKGQILLNEPLKRLSYTFQEIEGNEPPSMVRFEIECMGPEAGYRGEAVKLTLDHDGFASGSETYEGIRHGWPVIISGFKTLLETGAPLSIAWKGDDR